MELRKIVPIPLRQLGLDERWLQARISDDPSILGLGELEIVGREHRQPVGGRIDFLMRDKEEDTYYEVEIMLGALDESHIIRTFEYWDIERQRRPLFDHCAVIVAEKITTRFFNVLRLLNRSVPTIAVQLNAFRQDENTIGLLPITVLDIIEEVSDPNDVDQAERADRTFWERASNASALAAADKISELLRSANMAEARVTYNRGHIAIGTTGYNFCWLYRRTPPHFRMECKLESTMRDTVVDSLQAKGIDASAKRTDIVGFTMPLQELEKQGVAILDMLRQAEEFSKR